MSYVFLSLSPIPYFFTLFSIDFSTSGELAGDASKAENLELLSSLFAKASYFSYSSYFNYY